MLTKLINFIREFFTGLFTKGFDWITTEWGKVLAFFASLVTGWVAVVGVLSGIWTASKGMLDGLVIPQIQGSITGFLATCLDFANSFIPIGPAIQMFKAYLSLVIACVILRAWLKFGVVLRNMVGFK